MHRMFLLSRLVKTPGPIALEMARKWSGRSEDNDDDDNAGDGDAGGNNAIPLPAGSGQHVGWR